MGTVMAKDKNKKTLNAMGIDPDDSNLESPLEGQGSGEKRTVDLHGIKAKVDKVHFEGIVRTNEPVLRHTCKDLMFASNFEEVLTKAHEAKNKLKDLGIFKSVEIFIDSSSGPGSSPNGYEVTYQVNELKRFSGSVTSQAANNECLLIVGVRFPNIQGNADCLNVEYNYGSRRTNKIGLTYSRPFLNKRNAIGSGSIFSNAYEWPINGYKVRDTGFLFDYSLFSHKKMRHSFQYEFNWRQIFPGNKYAAFEVVENAGHKLKSCIRHITALDFTDSPIFPSSGPYTKYIVELSGLGGNLKFLKNELNFQYNIPLFHKGIVFQIGLGAGHMINFGDEVSIADNFFLGGPIDIRGFELRAMGPSKDGGFGGGTMYYGGALHLYTPLPFKPGTAGFGELFRTHFWVNAGNVGEFALDSASKFIDEQKENIRIVCGGGIALRLGQMARVELNLCYPFKVVDSDKFTSLSFGVGVHFL